MFCYNTRYGFDEQQLCTGVDELRKRRMKFDDSNIQEMIVALLKDEDKLEVSEPSLFPVLSIHYTHSALRTMKLTTGSNQGSSMLICLSKLKHKGYITG